MDRESEIFPQKPIVSDSSTPLSQWLVKVVGQVCDLGFCGVTRRVGCSAAAAAVGVASLLIMWASRR
jgi:hypothetical protein